MARNRQLVRQLTILRSLDCRIGRTLRELAEDARVTTRTIRRDLEALQEAGIPLVDETVESDVGDLQRRWRALDWRKEAA
jgi:predicted DNA-binding transcriptional regulator YafY